MDLHGWYLQEAIPCHEEGAGLQDGICSHEFEATEAISPSTRLAFVSRATFPQPHARAYNNAATKTDHAPGQSQAVG
jgi:hypothetical protein